MTPRYDHTVTVRRWLRRRVFDLRAWAVTRLGGTFWLGKCIICSKAIPRWGPTPHCPRLNCERRIPNKGEKICTSN